MDAEIQLSPGKISLLMATTDIESVQSTIFRSMSSRRALKIGMTFWLGFARISLEEEISLKKPESF